MSECDGAAQDSCAEGPRRKVRVLAVLDEQPRCEAPPEQRGLRVVAFFDRYPWPVGGESR
jgi:hypothetical protein